MIRETIGITVFTTIIIAVFAVVIAQAKYDTTRVTLYPVESDMDVLSSVPAGDKLLPVGE